MRHRFSPVTLLFLAGSFFFPLGQLMAQSAPAAYEGGSPLSIGAGMTSDNIDFGAGRRMEGLVLWIDWDLSGHKYIPKGLGLEVQGKTTRFGKPQGVSQMREDTLLGGVRYSMLRYGKFRPFAKGLMGLGSIDFPSYPNGYQHDTRTVQDIGAGFEYRVHNQIWVRAEYEYQRWPNLFGGTLTPSGVSVGATYHFRRHSTFR